MDFNSYKKVISNCNHIVKVGMVSMRPYRLHNKYLFGKRLG